MSTDPKYLPVTLFQFLSGLFLVQNDCKHKNLLQLGNTDTSRCVTLGQRRQQIKVHELSIYVS